MMTGRMSVAQYEKMIDYMEKHGDLSTTVHGVLGRASSYQKWEKLTQILNQDNSGSKKSVDKWKKVWADAKSKAKKKARIILQSAFDSENPDNEVILNPHEERIVGMMAWDFSGEKGQREMKLEFADDVDNSQQMSEAEDLPLSPQASPDQSPQPSPPPTPRLKSKPSARKHFRPTSKSHKTSFRRPSPDEERTTALNGTHDHRIKRKDTPSLDKVTRSLIEMQQKRLKLDMLREENTHKIEMEKLKLEHKKNAQFDQILQLLENALPRLLNLKKSS